VLTVAERNRNIAEDGVELTDLIRDVREALTSAMRSGGQGAGADEIKFELGPVELELEFVVEKSHKPGFSARMLVADVGYEHQRSRIATNRIKLVMQPRIVDQLRRRPLISGESVEGEE
jgi:hypothetical protein